LWEYRNGYIVAVFAGAVMGLSWATIFIKNLNLSVVGVVMVYGLAASWDYK
jgi:hypothetical protein